MDAIEELDADLSRLSRNGGSLRLALGRGLDALARQSGHHELGFSSLEAYALERCERKARWVQESRALARRLEALPAIRGALGAGKLTWSAAGVVARVATPESEEEWLHLAQTSTVRQLERVARDARELDAKRNLGAHAHAHDGATQNTALPDSHPVESEAFRTLTVTVDHADGWLFEAARRVVEHTAGARDADTVVEALVAEGFTTAQPWLPRDSDDHEVGPGQTQRDWETQLRRWREEAEELCEGRWRSAAEQADLEMYGAAEELRFDGAPESIDAELRKVARELASRDLVIGQIAEAFWKADGWRRLGFATEAQYVRERLGQRLSSVKAKRALARCVRRLPALGQAVEEARVGFEAACLVGSVADGVTLGDWVGRAEERTVCHLREEVDAARMLASLEARPMTPPDEELMRAVEELESQILSGAAFEGSDGALGTGPADNAGSGDDAGTGDDAGASGQGQISAGERETSGHGRRARGRVTLRLRVREGTYATYRWLEGLFVGRFGQRVPFFRFLCLSLLQTWKPAPGTKCAYAEVYARDRYRCRSPVCRRRDVTPHHLVYRAHGGDDSDENVLSLCVWCHLHGIHEGRLRADHPARDTRFRLGRRGHTVVHGRRRDLRSDSR